MTEGDVAGAVWTSTSIHSRTRAGSTVVHERPRPPDTAEARRRGLRSGVDRNRIWLWEQGGTTPNEESQLLLAAVLDVPAATVGSVG
ncbi:hypothetical protein ABZ722_33065 [Streptomyces longwoodensis]|uniref:hypothetical protein n=1 Tax=Streptomyces longwoodensis TaxID=68231 RepID=UPI0033C7CEA8